MKFDRSFYRAAFIVGIAVAATITAGQASAQIIYSNDFDHHQFTGTYREHHWEADWNDPQWEDGIKEKRVKIVDGYQAYGGSGRSLAVKYPKGKYGTKNTGAQWIMELNDSYDEVLLSYSVKFKRGFDFVKGGKLPGLAGGTAPTGNVAANGYNGWTTRMMWRTTHTGNPGSPKQKTSPAISYAKYRRSGPDNDGRIEDETPWLDPDGDLTMLKSNKWYDITQRIKMNDVGTSNGVLQIWLNDVLLVDKQDVEYRKTNSIGIDKLYFSTFFGGGYSWRTSKYETAYFDNFVIVAVD
ncbi:polysaccharide lyase [Planctomycetes bacterium K23_9]